MEHKSKTEAGKRATRLQKRAPASLKLDEIYNGKGVQPKPLNLSSESSNKIPLLSPLVVYPQPLTETSKTQIMSENGNKSERCSNVEGSFSSSMPSTGWQHPAMAPFPESSSLFTFFQKQCVIVNHGQ